MNERLVKLGEATSSREFARARIVSGRGFSDERSV